jgi:hypothetical protein
MIQEKQNNRKFTPRSKGMKYILRNPNPSEKDLNRLKSEIGKDGK